MVKQTRKKSRRQKRKSYGRIMKGGDFSDQERMLLQNNGFNNDQIDRIRDLGVTYAQVNEMINTISGEDFHGNSDDLADAVETAIFNEHMDQGIPHDQDDNHDMDLDQSFNSDNDNSLHLSDLDNSQSSGYTTDEDMSFEIGGKRRIKRNRKTIKKRKQIKKSIKGKKTRKQNRRKSRKIKGGACYGNGVGANSYDPNFSIHNTNLLKLFPYKPTN